MLSLDEYVGRRLRALRYSRSEEAEKVAAYLSISLERYAAVELGRKPIPARYLFDLSNFFDIPVTYFFAGHVSEDVAGEDERSITSGRDNGKATS